MLEKLKTIKPVYIYLSSGLFYAIGQSFIDRNSIFYDLLGVLSISIVIFAIYRYLVSK